MIDLGKCKVVTAVLKLKTSISPKGLIQYFTLGQKIYIFYALKDAIDHLLGIFFMLLLFTKNFDVYMYKLSFYLSTYLSYYLSRLIV